MEPLLEYAVLRRSPTATTVRLEGRLCEFSGKALDALAAEVPMGTDRFVLDVGGVSSINSVGVREWLAFLDRASMLATSIELRGCSVPFVAQLNMVAGFSGKANIHSVYLPFLCERCGSDKRVLAEIGERPPEINAPNCDCGAPMAFDDLEETYFTFMGAR